MATFYSKSTCGFYNSDIHGKKMPDDAVQITDAFHAELLEGQTRGKVIVANSAGIPSLQDRPPPSDEEMKRFLLARRESILTQTDGLVARHRDQLESGLLDTTLSTSQYRALQIYRQAWRDITEAKGFPQCEQPNKPAFL